MTLSSASQIERIQAQLRASAATQFDTASVAGFTCFINPDDDSPWSNYAIPTKPDAGRDPHSIDELTHVFISRSRVPRLEYLAAYASELASILENNGFTAEDSGLLMVCTPDSFRKADPVAGLIVETLTDQHPIDESQAMMLVQRRAFGNPAAAGPDVEEATNFRQRFGANTFFLGKLNGYAVTAGSLQLPYKGIAEIAGIATLADFRRRGLASALTSAIAAYGFAQGLDALFLTAGDQNAGRVYAGIGFQFWGEALAYSKHP